MLRSEVAPGTGGKQYLNVGQHFINDSDQVAFVANLELFAFGGSGLFLGSPGGPISKIAATGEVAPGTGGATYTGFQLVGINNAGDTAFIGLLTGGSTPRGLFLANSGGVTKLVGQGEPAPGTSGVFRLVNNPTGPLANPNYSINAGGDVAFVANVAGGGAVTRGIWIANTSGPPTKLIINTDPTGTSLGGSFNPGITFHGFNNPGKVLFSDNLSGASSPHALFLKDLVSAAQVIFANGQSAPGAGTALFSGTRQAMLNNNGNVAFLAGLSGGTSPVGWFFDGAAIPLVKIALEGESTPAGGVFGLALENSRGALNNSGQFAFFADILGPNGTGMFRFTLGLGNVSVVTSSDSLPPGANTVISTVMPGASGDHILFYASKAGGKIAAFTKPAVPGGGQITRIFGEGDTAPGAGGALWFFNPNFGLMNNEQEVAFNAFVIGGSAYPAQGIFTHKPGFGLRKIVISGDPAPGTAGGFFATADFGGIFLGPFGNSGPPARINSQGQVVFDADIFGSAGDSSTIGFFIGSAAGGVQRIVREGDPSPLGGTFVGFNSDVLPLSDSGLVAFQAVSQVGPSHLNGLFVNTGGGAAVKVVAQGDSIGGGVITANPFPFFFTMNNAGQVAYVVNLSGGPSPRGLFLGTAGGAQTPVALIGSAAPGTGGGTYSDLREQTMELNNAGQLAFWAGMTGSAAATGYFLFSPGSVVPRLLEGQSLPGGGTAATITPSIVNMVGDSLALSESGELAMAVFNVNGAPNITRLVIAGQNGVLRELAREGDKADGTGSSYGRTFQQMAVNSAARFFFLGALVDGPARWGIFSDK